MQNCWNLYLAGKQQQLYGPVNYRDFRETGPCSVKTLLLRKRQQRKSTLLGVMGSRVIGRYSEPHKSWPRTDRSGDPFLLPYIPCGIHRHEAESLKIACIKGALWAERGKHYFSSSPRLELRAKYRVRLAWLLKRLLCRLPQRWTSLGPVQLRPRGRKSKTSRNYSLARRSRA